jgi:hypothetical protein
MTFDEINKKSIELMIPINKQIQMTNDQEELVLLAMLMMNRARDILDESRGLNLRKKLFSEFSS